jgi:clan AA aspartic protease (TIGR02281 family)
MFKIACANVAAAMVAACLVTLLNQPPQIDLSASIPVGKSDRLDTEVVRICSHSLSVMSSDIKSTLVSSRVNPHLPAIGRVSLFDAAGVHILPVTINGVSGRFVLDTGAAYVSLTSELAAKAGIVKFENKLMKTVGGTLNAGVAYADSIAVDRAEAKDVVVAVIPSEINPFPDHTDGLLGMSFLARFKIELSQSGLTLSPI